MLLRKGPLEIRMEVAKNSWSNFLHELSVHEDPPEHIRWLGDVFLRHLGDNRVAAFKAGLR
jgi:hypothetical protein